MLRIVSKLYIPVMCLLGFDALFAIHFVGFIERDLFAAVEANRMDPRFKFRRQFCRSKRDIFQMWSAGGILFRVNVTDHVFQSSSGFSNQEAIYRLKAATNKNKKKE